MGLCNAGPRVPSDSRAVPPIRRALYAIMADMKRLLSLLMLAFPVLGQNALLTPVISSQFFDNNGKPLSGGFIYTCTAGTTCPGNPLATYQNSTATIANSNPIILDYTGSAQIRLTVGLSYKFVIQNAAGVQLRTVDNVSSSNNAFSALSSGTNTTAAMVLGTGGSLTYSGTGRINASQLAGVAASQYLFTNLTNVGTIAHALLFTDNTYNIGASGANRPANGYFSQSLNAASLNISGNAGVTGSLLIGSLTDTGGATFGASINAPSFTANWFRAGSTPGAPLVQGGHLAWNLNGSGETDFINSYGSGVGAFTWYNTGTAVPDNTTKLMNLDPTGKLTLYGTNPQIAVHVSDISYGTSTSTTCPTGTSDGATCSFTVTWNKAFSGTSYGASCTIVSPTGHPHIEGILSQTTSTIQVQIANGSASQAVASGGSSMSCVGVGN